MHVFVLASSAWAGFDPVTPDVLALPGEKSCGGSFLDLEQDGDWDLVAPADDELDGVRLLRNDGGGLLAWTDITADAAPELFEPGDTRGLLPADLNNDGWTDLVRVDIYEMQVLVNSGPPDFTLTRAFNFAFPGVESGYEGSAILDADGDGWLDVLMTGASLANWVMVNPADGTVALLPVDQGPLGMTPSLYNSDFATVADWDADGDIDAVIRGAGDGPDAFRAENGGWEAVVGFDLDASNEAKGAVALCDVRATGNLDLFWTLPTAPAVRRYTWNAANVAWDLLSDAALEATGTRSVTCGDLDNDGFVDLWLSDDDEDDTFFGPDLVGTLLEVAADGAWDTVATALADLDLDGDLDVYQVNDYGPNVLLANRTDDEQWLEVHLRANVGQCPGGPILRDDPGGSARVLDSGGAPITSRAEVSGGMGRGQMGWPILHFGGVDPTVDHLLSVDFLYGGDGPQVVRLAAGIHSLDVVSDDPDGDGISSAFEGPDDTDGDTFADELDDDSDGDGLLDRDEAATVDGCTPPVDTDGDDVPDFLDSDSDDDGLSDADEVAAGTDPTVPEGPAATTPTEPGPVSPFDADGDGVYDEVDPAPLDAGGVVASPPEPPAGCGCATGRRPAALGLGLLLALRRRRTTDCCDAASGS